MTTDSHERSGAEADLLRGFLNGSVAASIGLTRDDLQVGLDVAKSHLRRGALADALKVYAAMVLCWPNEVDLQIGLANCALQLEEFHLALQAASVAVALAPRHPRGYYLSGRACLGLGLAAEAVEDLEDAVSFGREARDALVVEEARRLLGAMPPPASSPARTAAMA